MRSHTDIIQNSFKIKISHIVYEANQGSVEEIHLAKRDKAYI